MFILEVIQAQSPYLSNLPKCLEKVIDKKVNGIALNIIERFAHCFFSTLYRPYKTVFKEKMAQHQRIHKIIGKELTIRKEHLLTEKIKLFDCTQNGIVEIRTINDHKFCVLKRKSEFFNQEHNLPIDFENRGFFPFMNEKETDFVVVKNLSDNKIEICEHRIPTVSDIDGEIRRWHTTFEIGGCYAQGYRFLARSQ